MEIYRHLYEHIGSRPAILRVVTAMNVRHAIRPAKPLKLIDIRFNEDSNIFTVSTPTGFAIYRTWPLALLRKRGKSQTQASRLDNGSATLRDTRVLHCP